MMDSLFEQSDIAGLLARDAKAVEKWFLTYSDAIYTFTYYRGQIGYISSSPKVVSVGKLRYISILLP